MGEECELCDRFGKQLAEKAMENAEIISQLVKAITYLEYQCADAEITPTGGMKPNNAMRIVTEAMEVLEKHGHSIKFLFADIEREKQENSQFGAGA